VSRYIYLRDANLFLNPYVESTSSLIAKAHGIEHHYRKLLKQKLLSTPFSFFHLSKSRLAGFQAFEDILVVISRGARQRSAQKKRKTPYTLHCATQYTPYSRRSGGFSKRTEAAASATVRTNELSLQSQHSSTLSQQILVRPRSILGGAIERIQSHH
jgi:hypothetical protein